MKWKRAKKIHGERACVLGIHRCPIDMLTQLYWIWGRLDVVPYLGCEIRYDLEQRLWALINDRAFRQFRRSSVFWPPCFTGNISAWRLVP
jgi:hypothetical protein